MHIHQSATTIKPLTDEVNGIDHLAAVQRFRGKPCLLAFTWTVFDPDEVNPLMEWRDMSREREL